ncbi:hypothetical protein AVEN_14569-1 [Araneus ventricosus]|uniref:Uncharacterized protein n=1 Tax=Araneus ventricosus TaxID=182803 RepID=A0A4Y2CF69_ARAVE|nr:hypothetical protein AVEN_14569-1 [Araneus ventricosus]
MDEVESLKKSLLRSQRSLFVWRRQETVRSQRLEERSSSRISLREDPYSLNFPVRYKFEKRKTILYGLNELWQSDLVDLQKLPRFNKGYRHILTIIEVTPRYLRAFPFKDKKASLRFSVKPLKRQSLRISKQIRVASLCPSCSV